MEVPIGKKQVSFGEDTISVFELPDDTGIIEKSVTETLREVVSNLRYLISFMEDKSPLTMVDRKNIRDSMKYFIQKITFHSDIECLITNVGTIILHDMYSQIDRFVVDVVKILVDSFKEFKEVVVIKDYSYVEKQNPRKTNLHVMIDVPLNVLSGYNMEQCLAVNTSKTADTSSNKRFKHLYSTNF